jgi:copper transport protein
MRRLKAALLAVALFWIAGPTLAGPAFQAVSAHAQLVSSVPGAGERLDQAPSQIILVFSERLDQLGTAVDLLDADGRLILRGSGAIDPADQRSFLVPLPALGDGLYTVNWRSLSADDGHSIQGFFSFGIGDDVVVPGAGQGDGGDIHSGHGLVQSVIETIARIAAELGAMLALGFVLIALAVLRPVDAGAARVVGRWASLALIAAGLGAAALIPLVASTAVVDPVAYALQTGSGQLLVARAALGLGIGSVALLIARGAELSAAFAAAGGVALTLLLALSGHGAGFESAAPILFVAVHVAAAGCWLAGLLGLAWLILGNGGRHRPLLGATIPRFSAVALVSVGLFATTSLYLWWLMNRAVIDLASNYGVLLVVKAVLALAAIALGGLSYLGWRSTGALGVNRRIPIEAGLALAVVAVTALLASGSPPGPTRPIPIERAATSSPNELNANLSLLPARPGPNRVIVNLPDSVVTGHETLELVLQRLDQTGETRVVLTLVPDNPQIGATGATDVPMPPGSQWDASARLMLHDAELSRARFVFAFDDAGLSQGQSRPVLDPLALVALALAAAAVFGFTIVLAGGALPRVERRLGRLTLLAGSIAAALLAVAAFIVGPQL